MADDDGSSMSSTQEAGLPFKLEMHHAYKTLSTIELLLILNFKGD
jgi:hypothetical protein